MKPLGYITAAISWSSSYLHLSCTLPIPLKVPEIFDLTTSWSPISFIEDAITCSLLSCYECRVDLHATLIATLHAVILHAVILHIAVNQHCCYSAKCYWNCWFSLLSSCMNRVNLHMILVSNLWGIFLLLFWEIAHTYIYLLLFPSLLKVLKYLTSPRPDQQFLLLKMLLRVRCCLAMNIG